MTASPLGSMQLLSTAAIHLDILAGDTPPLPAILVSDRTAVVPAALTGGTFLAEY